MDELCRPFFRQPQATFQRRYEALRAYFLDGQPVAVVADRFGYRRSSFKSLLCRFRAACAHGEPPPLFVPDGRGRPAGQRRCEDQDGPEPPEGAAVRLLSLAPGRRLRTRVAGSFWFLPLLARLALDRLVSGAGYPGARLVPAASAVLSLLALKLLDKERPSHIDDFNFDEALGLFAGLNILPKKSCATDDA